LINPFFIFCKCSFPSFFSKGSSLSFPPGSIRDYLNSILTLVKEVDFRLASWESFFGYSEIGPERIVKILLISYNNNEKAGTIEVTIKHQHT